MSGLDNLQTRLNYLGGGNQQSRMIADKLRSLKKSLLAAYQANTAIIPDGREFRCLINPNNLKPDYNKMIISIPFEDVCLNRPRVGTTTQGIEKIDLKCGDVFELKEDGTLWLIYLRYTREKAYFRAEIFQCEAELEINGKKYPVYIQGPTETDIKWNQKAQVEWNDLNYQAMIYITKDENTIEFFERFKRLKIDGKQYQVSSVDPYSADGVLQVYFQEDFTNTIEDEGYIEPTPITPPNSGPRILGSSVVRPYDTVTFTVDGIEEEGYWEISNPKKAQIISSDSSSVKLEIITGKSGEFNLNYKIGDEIVITLLITVSSL